MLLSPEVRNAIHVGDRILEINGLPVGTMMEAEVGLNLTRMFHSRVTCMLHFDLLHLVFKCRCIPAVFSSCMLL